MTDHDDFESRLRATMAAGAARVRAPGDLQDQAAAALARRRRRRERTGPVLAGVSLLAVLAISLPLLMGGDRQVDFAEPPPAGVDSGSVGEDPDAQPGGDTEPLDELGDHDLGEADAGSPHSSEVDGDAAAERPGEPVTGASPPEEGAAERQPQEGEGGGAADADDGDRVEDGTWGPVVRIGVHLSLSGHQATPGALVRLDTRRWGEAMGEVHGRRVEVVVADDQSNPSRAATVCQAFAREPEVVAVVGIGDGTGDAVASCARMAAQEGVPYLAAGLPDGLGGLDGAFPLAMSAEAQARLVLERIEATGRPDRAVLGVLRQRGGSGAAADAVGAAARSRGYTVREIEVGGPGDHLRAAQTLSRERIEVAVPLLSPEDWRDVVRAPGAGGTRWVGLGPGLGWDRVAESVCSSSLDAQLLSPWPGLNTADRLDPAFRRAGGSTDVEWAAWGAARTVRAALELAGPDLRAGSLEQVLTTRTVRGGIFGELRHSPGERPAVTESHVLRADCDGRRFVSGPDDLFLSAPR